MSADNWTQCPQCVADHRRAKRQLEAEAAASYGKVPADKYEQLRSAATVVIHNEPTLREDYEIGMSTDGELVVSYSCYCNSCTFRYEFAHKKRALVRP